MGSCLPVVPKEQGEHPCFSLEQLRADGGECPEPPLRTSNLGEDREQSGCSRGRGVFC